MLKWVLSINPFTWSLKKGSRLYFFFIVTCNVPRFFHYEYKHDEFGKGTYVATSLYRDRIYHIFWHTWQSLIYTFIPIIALCSINGKILWNLSKSKQKDAEICQNNGLRIHVGWVLFKISGTLQSFFLYKITVFPHVVSAETILFLLWPYVLWPLINVRKLFKGGNYSRAETIWGNTVTGV